MIITILVIMLTDPAGITHRIEEAHQGRAECRTAKALIHATMIEAPRGYTLVSADCEAKS